MVKRKRVNKRTTKIILLLAYSIPYIFIGLYEDLYVGFMLGYLLMLIALGALLYWGIKTKNSKVVIAGNMLSCISSYICTTRYIGEEYNYYFKPFTATQLALIIIVFMILVQLFVAYWIKKK